MFRIQFTESLTNASTALAGLITLAFPHICSAAANSTVSRSHGIGAVTRLSILAISYIVGRLTWKRMRQKPEGVKKSLVLSAVFIAAVALFLLSGAPVKAAEPNLSGEWKLNLAKSDYGKFPTPISVTRKIDHNGSKLVLTTTQKGAQGDVTSKLAYTTDGKESVNEVAGGQSKGTAQWIGEMLMIESSREFQGATLKQKEIWRPSSDGKVLTIDSHVSIPNGEFDVKQVFDKQ